MTKQKQAERLPNNYLTTGFLKKFPPIFEGLQADLIFNWVRIYKGKGRAQAQNYSAAGIIIVSQMLLDIITETMLCHNEQSRLFDFFSASISFSNY